MKKLWIMENRVGYEMNSYTPVGVFHSVSYFTLRSNISQILLGIYFVAPNKKDAERRLFYLCKDYKKDIFGRFAYDFELSQNILSFLI